MSRKLDISFLVHFVPAFWPGCKTWALKKGARLRNQLSKIGVKSGRKLASKTLGALIPKSGLFLFLSCPCMHWLAHLYKTKQHWKTTNFPLLAVFRDFIIFCPLTCAILASSSLHTNLFMFAALGRPSPHAGSDPLATLPRNLLCKSTISSLSTLNLQQM